MVSLEDEEICTYGLLIQFQHFLKINNFCQAEIRMNSSQVGFRQESAPAEAEEEVLPESMTSDT